MPYWIHYASMPPCGFQKPKEPRLNMPRIMCTSCGGGFTKNSYARTHVQKYYCAESGEMNCSPDSSIKASRVAWYCCVLTEGLQRYMPTTKKSECPICFDNKILVPVCENEHLVCEQCEATASFSLCPICRDPVVSPTDRLLRLHF